MIGNKWTAAMWCVRVDSRKSPIIFITLILLLERSNKTRSQIVQISRDDFIETLKDIRTILLFALSNQVYKVLIETLLFCHPIHNCHGKQFAKTFSICCFSIVSSFRSTKRKKYYTKLYIYLKTKFILLFSISKEYQRIRGYMYVYRSLGWNHCIIYRNKACER